MTQIYDTNMTCCVTGIGTCTNTNINIPKKISGYTVVGIADKAFSGCSNLTSITIPNSVTSIGQNAFEACDRLTTINCGFVEGRIAGAPWGAPNTTNIKYSSGV